MSARNTVTAERQNRIAELSAQGVPIVVIATKVGISQSAVVRHRAKLGLTGQKVTTRRTLTADQIEHMRKRLFDDGARVETIAQELQCGIRTVHRHFPNLSSRPRPTPMKVPDDVIRRAWRLVREGKSRRTAAATVGISTETMRRRGKELGYPATFDDNVPCPHGCGRHAHPLPAKATSVLGWPACEGGTTQGVAA